MKSFLKKREHSPKNHSASHWVKVKFLPTCQFNSADKFSRIIEECRQAGLNVQGNFLVNPSLDSYEGKEPC
jgi:hypothetical protein